MTSNIGTSSKKGLRKAGRIDLERINLNLHLGPNTILHAVLKIVQTSLQLQHLNITLAHFQPKHLDLRDAQGQSGIHYSNLGP